MKQKRIKKKLKIAFFISIKIEVRHHNGKDIN